MEVTRDSTYADDDRDHRIVLLGRLIKPPQGFPDLGQFFFDDDPELTLHKHCQLGPPQDRTGTNLRNSISIDQNSLRKYLVLFKEQVQPLEHHAIEIGDHLQCVLVAESTAIIIRVSTDLLLTLLNLHAAGELSIEGITAGYDSRDRRRPFDASGARVGDIDSNNHGGLLLQPRHALLVELVAKNDKQGRQIQHGFCQTLVLTSLRQASC